MADHNGHGFMLASSYNETGTGDGTAYNTIKYCTAKNFDGESFAVRYRQVYNNTFEDCTALGGDGDMLHGLIVRDGAHDNTFRRCMVDGMEYGVSFWDTTEDGGTQNAGHDNTFEYCIFQNQTGITSNSFCIDFNVYQTGYTGSAYNNKWINCVFDDGDYLINSSRPNSGNELVNCIITDVTEFIYGF